MLLVLLPEQVNDRYLKTIFSLPQSPKPAILPAYRIIAYKCYTKYAVWAKNTMKSISINLITAPTVRMPLVPHKAHKVCIFAAIALFIANMAIISGGFIPLVTRVSRGAVATIAASFSPLLSLRLAQTLRR